MDLNPRCRSPRPLRLCGESVGCALLLAFAGCDGAAPPTASVSLPSVNARAPRPAEVLHAPDGLLSVWNYDTGLGGSLPDYVTTVRWWNERGMHDRTFRDAERGGARLGWVESAAVFPADAGRLYVLACSDPASRGLFHTRLIAFLVRKGSDQLETLEHVFPEMPGTDTRRTQVDWAWWWNGTEDLRAQRPFAVWLIEKAGEIRVRVRPELAAQGRGADDAFRFAAREFRLCFNGREFMYRDDVGAETGNRTTARLVREVRSEYVAQPPSAVEVRSEK